MWRESDKLGDEAKRLGVAPSAGLASKNAKAAETLGSKLGQAARLRRSATASMAPSCVAAKVGADPRVREQGPG